MVYILSSPCLFLCPRAGFINSSLFTQKFPPITRLPVCEILLFPPLGFLFVWLCLLIICWCFRMKQCTKYAHFIYTLVKSFHQILFCHWFWKAKGDWVRALGGQRKAAKRRVKELRTERTEGELTADLAFCLCKESKDHFSWLSPKEIHEK